MRSRAKESDPNDVVSERKVHGQLCPIYDAARLVKEVSRKGARTDAEAQRSSNSVRLCVLLCAFA
jgi:hypothetical protein